MVKTLSITSSAETAKNARDSLVLTMLWTTDVFSVNLDSSRTNLVWETVTSLLPITVTEYLVLLSKNTSVWRRTLKAKNSVLAPVQWDLLPMKCLEDVNVLNSLMRNMLTTRNSANAQPILLGMLLSMAANVPLD
jgi:hypothetical protein